MRAIPIAAKAVLVALLLTASSAGLSAEERPTVGVDVDVLAFQCEDERGEVEAAGLVRVRGSRLLDPRTVESTRLTVHALRGGVFLEHGSIYALDTFSPESGVATAPQAYATSESLSFAFEIRREHGLAVCPSELVVSGRESRGGMWFSGRVATPIDTPPLEAPTPAVADVWETFSRTLERTRGEVAAPRPLATFHNDELFADVAEPRFSDDPLPELPRGGVDEGADDDSCSDGDDTPVPLDVPDADVACECTWKAFYGGKGKDEDTATEQNSIVATSAGDEPEVQLLADGAYFEGNLSASGWERAKAEVFSYETMKLQVTCNKQPGVVCCTDSVIECKADPQFTVDVDADYSVVTVTAFQAVTGCVNSVEWTALSTFFGPRQDPLMLFFRDIGVDQVLIDMLAAQFASNDPRDVTGPGWFASYDAMTWQSLGYNVDRTFTVNHETRKTKRHHGALSATMAGFAWASVDLEPGDPDKLSLLDEFDADVIIRDARTNESMRAECTEDFNEIDFMYESEHQR